MFRFEINQQTGRSISKKNFRRWLDNLAEELKLKKPLEVSIGIVGSSAMKKLNKNYRNKNRVTDVLSFSENDIRTPKFKAQTKNYLGEVIICYPQALRQAKQNNQTLSNELELLLVHGVLHLLGYDHEKSGEAKKMEALEQRILSKSGL